METLRTLIIDDELKGQNLLNELVKRYCPDVQVLGMASSAKEGIALIRQFQPDFIFLDINMPEINGFQMLEMMGDVSFEIVFVTAYNEFAVKAYKYSAFDYLLKPVDPEELRATIERLKVKKRSTNLQERFSLLMRTLEEPKKQPSKITISASDGISLLNIQDIVYLEADGPYTTFFLQNNEKLVSSHNLKEYEEMLENQGFFRCHHSYLVNLNHIRKYVKSDGYLLMDNGRQVEVSKRKKEECMAMLATI
ncbi:MAG: LytTR family DNA-binding domain-containing protein [Spirosomataceae bacterium]|mgnify:CR=1 FL=1